MLLDFLPTFPDDTVYSYEKVAYHEIKPMLVYDKIDIAICCNESATDWELHDLIVASKGQIVDILMAGLREKAAKNRQVAHDEYELYAEEIHFFIQRLNAHPTSLAHDR